MAETDTENRPCVVIVSGSAGEYGERLAERGASADFVPCGSYDALPGVLGRERPDAVLAFKIGKSPFPREALLDCPSLRWIHAGGAGIDHLTPWDPERITVTNSSGIHGDIMAQHVLCMMLMWNFRMPDYLRQQTEKTWKLYESKSLADQTLGVIGFGAVGRIVGETARKMGMRVLAVRSSGAAEMQEADRVTGPETMAEVAAASDFLAICLPLTDQTRGLIGAEVLDALPPHAVLIDVSRGGIVAPDMLLDRLRAGAFRGASLDVFAQEPLPPDNPLWSLENVIVTPHSSSDIVGWQDRVVGVFADNLRRWRGGEALRNVVDPTRGY